MTTEAHYERACKLLLLAGALINWTGVLVFMLSGTDAPLEALGSWASTRIDLLLQTL